MSVWGGGGRKECGFRIFQKSSDMIRFSRSWTALENRQWHLKLILQCRTEITNQYWNTEQSKWILKHRTEQINMKCRTEISSEYWNTEQKWHCELTFLTLSLHLLVCLSSHSRYSFILFALFVGFSLVMSSASSLLFVTGIIFLVNVCQFGKVVSFFPRAVPLPMKTTVWPMREVMTRAFRKSGSTTRAWGRPFLIIEMLSLCLTQVNEDIKYVQLLS